MTYGWIRYSMAGFAAVAILAATSQIPFAQLSSDLTRKTGDAGEIRDAIAKDSRVRVIVRYNDPAAAADMKADSQTSIDATKAANAAIQSAIIADHFGSADAPRDGTGFPRGIRRFDLTAGFAVNVTQEELNALAADPRITIINFDRQSKPGLVQSIPLQGIQAAHTAGATGNGQIVVILDTGVQQDHEFFNGRVIAAGCWSNSGGQNLSLCPNGQQHQTGLTAANPNIQNCIGSSGQTAGQQLCDHGTHVAGTAGSFNSSPSAGEPTKGTAPNALIFGFQVFTRVAGGCNGTSCITAFDSDQVSALDSVFQSMNSFGNSKIASVNMSIYGGPNVEGTCDDAPHKPGVDRLRAAGVITVIISGNDGERNKTSKPGCISSAFTVSSTTKSDIVSSFSNIGTKVDLFATGGELGGPCNLVGNEQNVRILAPVPDFNGTLATDKYSCKAGTSMAAPHVAGAIAVIRGACPNASVQTIENALKGTGKPIADQRSSGIWTKPRLQLDQAVAAACAAAGGLVNSILPTSRSVRVGSFATAFNTTINAGATGGTSCGLQATAATSVPANFAYQTTNPATNQVTGTANTPVNIPPNGTQTYVFAVNPQAAFPPTDITILAACTNLAPGPRIVGVNTILVSASNTPVPDIVALAASGTPGYVVPPGANATGVFAVASVNVGSAASITVSADTGAATLPVNITLCQTDPATANCTSAIGPTVTTNIAANGTPTFGIFVQATGTVADNPATNRVFVRFKDGGGATRGSTSVAVKTQ